MTIQATALTPMQKNRTLGLIVTGHGVAHWYNGIMGVLYPILTVSLGLTYSQVGLFDSGRGAVAVIVSLAGGYLADRFGQQRLFLAFCLISLGIFTSLLGFATMFTLALLLLMGGGIGNSLWHPYALPLLHSIFPNRKSLALALHDAGANSFHGLAPIVVGTLLTMFSWQYVTKMHLWPGVLMGLLILIGLPQFETAVKSSDERTRYTEAWKSGIMRNRGFLLASGISASLTMARMGLFTFLPLFLAFELGLDSAAQGLYMGVMTFAGALLAPISGALADRFGLRRILSIAALVASLVAIAIAFAQPGLLFLGTIALMGGALFSTRSLILVHVMSVTPEGMGGSSIGTIFSLNRFFGILSPIIAGSIADNFGLRFVFYFVSVLLVVGLILTMNLQRRQQAEVASNE